MINDEDVLVGELADHMKHEYFKDEKLWMGYALSRSAGELITHRLNAVRPTSVLELGSGSSTLIFGEYAKVAGASVVSLEHMQNWWQRTDTLLAMYGFRENVELHHVLLDDAPWYEYEPREAQRFDFVLVDGPPGHTGGRRHALPKLWNYLVPHFEMWVDDANRMPEKKFILEDWQKKYPIDVDFVETGPQGRKMARITRNDLP